MNFDVGCFVSANELPDENENENKRRHQTDVGNRQRKHRVNQENQENRENQENQENQQNGRHSKRRRRNHQNGDINGDINDPFLSDNDDADDGEDNDEVNGNGNGNVVCCSIHYEKSVLGMASYDDEASLLRVSWMDIDTTSPTRDVTLARTIALYVEEIRPSFIVLSSKVEQFIHDTCCTLQSEKQDPNAFVPEDFVAVTSANNFNVVRSNRTLVEFCGAHHSHIMASNASLCACGGLIQYLIQHQVLIPPANGAEPPLRIKISRTADNVLIDQMSLFALDIFSIDVHPNIQGSQRSKEGFSLSALLCSYCRTSSAKKMIRRWLRRPTNDRATLHYRYDTIDTFLSTSAHESQHVS
jgi:DNA mismatch repair ATPase MutS